MNAFRVSRVCTDGLGWCDEAHSSSLRWRNRLNECEGGVADHWVVGERLFIVLLPQPLQRLRNSVLTVFYAIAGPRPSLGARGV